MKNERRKRIRETIDTNGEITLLELQDIFPSCSAMTLRRDLIALEEEGAIKRTRGGAIALKRMMESEGLYNQRAAENMAGKMEIARYCADLLGADMSLYLDSGTTMMCLAKQLLDSYRSVITNGVNISMELVKRPNFSVTLLGGQMDSNTLSTSGQVTQTMMNSFNIETAVMSGSGFDMENGFSNTTFSECELKRMVIRKASKVIMLIDRHKFGRIMPLTFASLEDIDILISDHRPDDSLLARCMDMGVKYIYTRADMIDA